MILAFPNSGHWSTRMDLSGVNNKVEFCVGSSRSSIKHLYDVIPCFDERKKELVRAIGFGGILDFPPLRQINWRFAVWLMSSVDPSSQTLVIDPANRTKFNKVDVDRAVGIPCRGRSISKCGVPPKEIIRYLDYILGQVQKITAV